MTNIRDILETAESGPMQLMKDMKMDIYGKEVFAFTPKGDLFRLASGATVLDFAFQIHTNAGAHCTGAVVNGQHRKITYRINNGDTIEILTSSNQYRSPTGSISWSARRRATRSSRASTRSLQRRAELGKEILERTCQEPQGGD